MKINLHKNARTTPAQREFIQNNTQMNVSNLALKIGVSETTVRRWKKRTFVFDKSHTPKKIVTALTPFQELMVVLIRLCLRSGLDDLHRIVQRFILPNCSRSGLNRCLKRYNISRLTSIQRDLPFNLNDYRGTFLYYTKIQFPGMSERPPFCIQILLDYSFRWVHAEMCTPPQKPPLNFIKKVIHDFPITVLGIVFTDPVVLSDMDSLETNTRHGQLINNYCSVHGLISYHKKTDLGEILVKLRKTCSDLQKDPCPSLISKLNTAGLTKNISVYNTQLYQRTLKQKTPSQSLNCHYACFPGSFRQRPKQSSGTLA